MPEKKTKTKTMISKEEADKSNVIWFAWGTLLGIFAMLIPLFVVLKYMV